MIEDNIFTNQDKVVENLRDSASNLGIDPNKVAPLKNTRPKQVLVAKKNCKKCYGQGVFTIAGHDVKTEGKKEGRNSRKQEPSDSMKGIIYCKCVKIVEGNS